MEPYSYFIAPVLDSKAQAAMLESTHTITRDADGTYTLTPIEAA